MPNNSHRMRNILYIIGIIVLVVVALASFTGLVPGLSGVLGSNKPRNLGITYTKEDETRAYEKNGVIASALPKTNNVSDSIRYEGKKDVEFTMSSEEITALNNSNTWQYLPVSNIQIRINPDGTGEASGILHVDRILPYISLSHSTEKVRQAIADYHIGGSPAFYLKGRVSVINNEVSLNPDRVEIGRIAIPSSLVAQNIVAAAQFAEARIKAVPNLFVRSLTHTDGNVHFSGTMPEREFTSE